MVRLAATCRHWPRLTPNDPRFQLPEEDTGGVALVLFGVYDFTTVADAMDMPAVVGANGGQTTSRTANMQSHSDASPVTTFPPTPPHSLCTAAKRLAGFLRQQSAPPISAAQVSKYRWYTPTSSFTHAGARLNVWAHTATRGAKFCRGSGRNATRREPGPEVA